MTIEESTFQPAWWLRGPHRQTLYPVLARRHHPRVPTRRERLELPDGDFLDLDWGPGNDGPLVLILHGLEGSIRSHYARGLLSALARRGWRGVVMHFRSCSGEPNRLPRSYHSGETGDLDWVVRLLHRREPQTALTVVGYSLGGNVLLKWLGEQGESVPLHTAVAVSVPFDLGECANRTRKGLSRIYLSHLMRNMRRSLRAKQDLMELPIGGVEIDRLTDFWSFDNAITAPLNGFRDVHHYYAHASSRAYLRTIHLPTLILHARDDPFMTPAVIPQPCELAEPVRLELSEHGGHVGFVAGEVPWRAEYWLEHRICQHLAAWLD